MSGDDIPLPARSAWPMALLASYASAVTLACGWLWWTGHRGGGPSGSGPVWVAGLEASDDPENRGGGPSDSGRRSDSSTTVEPLEPIGEDRLLTVGEPSRIDALEVVPIGVSSGSVELRRTRVDGRSETKDGGRDALRLHLRLRNTSDDAVFAPLDEAFVREPDRRLPETFIQDEAGARVYSYRLPVSSEWEIAGQEFIELRPGEVIETTIVSDTESSGRLDGPLTWRLRLRSAPGTTAVVGVPFHADDIDRGR